MKSESPPPQPYQWFVQLQSSTKTQNGLTAQANRAIVFIAIDVALLACKTRIVIYKRVDNDPRSNLDIMYPLL